MSNEPIEPPIHPQMKESLGQSTRLQIKEESSSIARSRDPMSRTSNLEEGERSIIGGPANDNTWESSIISGCLWSTANNTLREASELTADDLLD